MLDKSAVWIYIVQYSVGILPVRSSEHTDFVVAVTLFQYLLTVRSDIKPDLKQLARRCGNIQIYVWLFNLRLVPDTVC